MAQAAAQALLDNTDLDARTIVEKALAIAGDICIYTNIFNKGVIIFITVNSTEYSYCFTRFITFDYQYWNN